MVESRSASDRLIGLGCAGRVVGGLGCSTRRRWPISKAVGDAVIKDTRLLAQWLMGYVDVRRASCKGLVTGFRGCVGVCIDRGSVVKWAAPWCEESGGAAPEMMREASSLCPKCPALVMSLPRRAWWGLLR